MSGTKGLSPTYEQAHMGLDLLTLASYNSINKQIENRMEKCAMTLIGVREHE